jgi:hypothetical protein
MAAGQSGSGPRPAAAAGAVQRLGVDFRDDVLTEQPDGLQGGLEVSTGEAEGDLVAAGGLPAATLLERGEVEVGMISG